MSAQKIRIYEIKDINTGETLRLVRAQNKPAALSYAARSSWSCEFASQEVLYAATIAGVKCEDIVDPDDDLAGKRSMNAELP